jgi:hypothetical protein
MKIFRSRLLAIAPAIFLIILSCVRSQTLPPVSGKQQKVSGLNERASNARVNEEVAGIARIIDLPDNGIKILFYERQNPFIVTREHPEYANIVRVARQAFAEGKPVKLFSPEPGVLDQLAVPTEAELRQYEARMRMNLRNVDPVRRVNFREADSAVFNNVIAQNWKAFRFCKKIVPSLATAKAIFDYCKQQACIIGPTQEQPCIPFQYVIDGCFARANKMRLIIEKKFGYCTEKVFSFGDDLYVRAGLWGGCCVNWWYHVAPLIRVEVAPGLQMCYVIDPSMFTEPVPLLTWLFTQEDKTCNNAALFLSYAIQPPAAYYPVGGYPPGNTYATDPAYADTNEKLVYYNTFGPTCPQ